MLRDSTAHFKNKPGFRMEHDIANHCLGEKRPLLQGLFHLFPSYANSLPDLRPCLKTSHCDEAELQIFQTSFCLQVCRILCLSCETFASNMSFPRQFVGTGVLRSQEAWHQCDESWRAIFSQRAGNPLWHEVSLPLWSTFSRALVLKQATFFGVNPQ